MKKEKCFSLNKKKIFLRIILQVILIILCILGFITIIKNRTYSLSLLLLLIPVLVAQFGTNLLFALGMFFSTSPGLIVSPTGIVDNTTGVSAGTILWENITNISVTETANRYVTIEVADPKIYLAKGNTISRLYKKLNYTFFKSPIHISAHALDISFAEMARVIEKYYSEYGSQNRGT